MYVDTCATRLVLSFDCCAIRCMPERNLQRGGGCNHCERLPKLLGRLLWRICWVIKRVLHWSMQSECVLAVECSASLIFICTDSYCVAGSVSPAHCPNGTISAKGSANITDCVSTSALCVYNSLLFLHRGLAFQLSRRHPLPLHLRMLNAHRLCLSRRVREFSVLVTTPSVSAIAASLLPALPAHPPTTAHQVHGRLVRV